MQYFWNTYIKKEVRKKSSLITTASVQSISRAIGIDPVVQGSNPTEVTEYFLFQHTFKY